MACSVFSRSTSLTSLANVVSNVFRGSNYIKCRKDIDDAVREYTSIMTDLGVAIRVQTWIQGGEVLKNVIKTNNVVLGFNSRLLHY